MREVLWGVIDLVGDSPPSERAVSRGLPPSPHSHMCSAPDLPVAGELCLGEIRPVNLRLQAPRGPPTWSDPCDRTNLRKSPSIGPCHLAGPLSLGSLGAGLSRHGGGSGPARTLHINLRAVRGARNKLSCKDGINGQCHRAGLPYGMRKCTCVCGR